jgi:GTPase SAR1 family protein
MSTGTNPTPEDGLDLVYSADVLDRELLAQAEELTVSLSSGNPVELFGRDLARQIAGAPNALRERLASAFSIMIVGDFKRGKSTLINALVGQDVAPTDVAPETMSINRIEYADEFTARLQSKDGGEATIRREDLRRDRLEPLLRRLPSPLRHLRVGVPVPALRNVTFVDTPGLGDLFAEFEQLVSDYIEQADAIIYVLSSTSPLSMTEQEFLLSSISPHHFPKVFFIVNAIDVFANEEQERKVTDLVRAKLDRIMPGCTLYAISALDEWSRVSGGARPKPERAPYLDQAFAAFRRDLDDAVRFRQRYYLLDRASWWFGNLLATADQRAGGLEDALRRDVEQLDAAVHAIEEGQYRTSAEFRAASDALENGFEKLRREAEDWMTEFLNRLDGECFAKLPNMKTSQLRQHLPFFIKDRLRRGMEACLLSHQPAITELFETYAKGIEANTAAALQAPSAAPTLGSPDVRWSHVDTAELVVKMLPVGALLHLGAALFGRAHKDAHSAQYAQDLAGKLPELREQVRTQVREIYTGVKERIVAAWTERHEEDLQAQLSDLKRAVQLRETGAERVKEAQERLAEVRELVASKRAFLDQFKPKVWSGIAATAASAA